MSQPTANMTNSRLVIDGVSLLGDERAHTIIIEAGVIQSVSPQTLPSENKAQGSHEHGLEVHHIDASSLIAIPGMTDLYTRLREPGMTRKGTIASECRRALRVGFTRLICSPDTQPAIDSVATVELIRHRAHDAMGAQVLPMAALTVGLDGEQLSELATLHKAGCLVAGQADRPLESTNVLYSAMEYAASFKLPLFMTARDAQLGIDGCAHTGAMATRLGLPGIPVAAEAVALARLLELTRETGCRLHISRISSARAVDMISAAKQASLPVTCDVGLHHLYFTDEQLAGYDSSFHCAVPFRSPADRDALRAGVKSGVIDAICSDHSPHDKDAKLAPFPATEPGLTAYDFAIPLILQLVNTLDMPLELVFDKFINAPARIIGCDAPALQPGQAANFFLLAPLDTLPQSAGMDKTLNPSHPLDLHAPESLGLQTLKGCVRQVCFEGHLHEF